ncbi:MAG: AsnC family transcriptional regulator [Rhodospirillales bacterium]|nr:AsnC family transcriptional regulator [Rhodospirillales bacterium]
MPVSVTDRRLLTAIEDGLPLVPEPYAELGRRLGLSEAEVIARLQGLIAGGVIKRFGMVVRHRDLGYTANAMAVWDVPDDRVGAAGRRLAEFPFVTLCYRRRRQPPVWPYNLFCMIHGTDRRVVCDQIAQINSEPELAHCPHAVLFSRRAFKQRGARYSVREAKETA